MRAVYCSNGIGETGYGIEVLFYCKLFLWCIWEFDVSWGQTDDAIKNVGEDTAQGRLGNPGPVSVGGLEVPSSQEPQAAQNLHMSRNGMPPVIK